MIDLELFEIALLTVEQTKKAIKEIVEEEKEDE